MNIIRVERSDAAGLPLSALPWQGITACVLLIAEVIMLLAALYLSSLSEGNGGLKVGVVGFLAMLAAAAGLIIALSGLRRKDIRHGLCYIGGIGSLLVLGGMITLCAVA